MSRLVLGLALLATIDCVLATANVVKFFLSAAGAALGLEFVSQVVKYPILSNLSELGDDDRILNNLQLAHLPLLWDQLSINEQLVSKGGVGLAPLH